MSRELLENYADNLMEKFSIQSTAQRESIVASEVKDLINSIGSQQDFDLDILGEIHLSAPKVRPDLGIYIGKLLCGLVEIKAPGYGANPSNFKEERNKEQWNKLKDLPNLIYTDGIEWALYRNGTRVDGHGIIRLSEEIFEKGRLVITNDNVNSFSKLFLDFFNWEPDVPSDPTELAKFLAPIARLLRSEVENSAKRSESAIASLAKEWRHYFFPDADNLQFADAYAQTVTYALLLARLSGASDLDPKNAAKILDKNNGLLAQTLEILAQNEAQKEVPVGFNLMQRTLESLNPSELNKSKTDLWIYFYEEFLQEYNPKLRKELGVFYTPKEIVRLQVRLTSELLEKRFNKRHGFADDGVTFIDPAVGTGTYLVEAVQHGLNKVKDNSGAGAIPARANEIVKNMYGFEILVGPYAVAHLRLTQIIENALNIGKKKSEPDSKLDERLKIYLADTLESPQGEPQGRLDLPLMYRTLTAEHEAARELKNKGEILVCIGNPPYNRQEIKLEDDQSKRKGGWVRFGDTILSQDEKTKKKPPILDDFIKDAKSQNAGKHLKNLYNDYVYFWRWALWRLFEQEEHGAVVSFITPSSFINGPGFVGMRQFMRQTFDEMWIIDLGGNNLGTRKSVNVFNIQIPVAITIGIRGSKKFPDTPAKIKYTKVEASTRNEKLGKLENILDFDSGNWEDCQSGWYDSFLPTKKGNFFEWPKLGDLFPWTHSGVQFKRTWPIAETEKLLEKRWEILCTSKFEDRRKMFKETESRHISIAYKDIYGKDTTPLRMCNLDSPKPLMLKYGYRFLDRRFAIIDNRFADRLRPQLIQTYSEKNIYFASLTTNPIDVGPTLIASAYIPDLHFLFGGGNREIFPFYKDSECKEFNITNGILPLLSKEFNTDVSAVEFATYVYGILGGQSFVQKFWEELAIPGARVPITKNKDLFFEVAEIGKDLLCFHTFGERLNDLDKIKPVPMGKARVLKGIPHDTQYYPDDFEYIEESNELLLGSGKIGPIDSDVWNYRVSNMRVIESWIKYRLKNRKGKKTSILDDIRPESWLPNMTDELLDIIWIVEATIEMEPRLEGVLDKIVSGKCFTSKEIPLPKKWEREPPEKISPNEDQFRIIYHDFKK